MRGRPYIQEKAQFDRNDRLLDVKLRLFLNYQRYDFVSCNFSSCVASERLHIQHVYPLFVYFNTIHLPVIQTTRKLDITKMCNWKKACGQKCEKIHTGERDFVSKQS